MTANRLHRRFGQDEAEIHVVDRDDRHVTSRACSSSPSGSRIWRRSSGRGGASSATASSSIRTRSKQSGPSATRCYSTTARCSYDVLVVATGVRLQPGETEGMTGPGWMERVFTFYDAEGAAALHDALERFDGGRLLVNLVDMPISARSRRSSSPSSPTGTCASAGSATAPSSSTPPRSTAPSRSRSRPSTLPACSPKRRSSS